MEKSYIQEQTQNSDTHKDNSEGCQTPTELVHSDYGEVQWSDTNMFGRVMKQVTNEW